MSVVKIVCQSFFQISLQSDGVRHVDGIQEKCVCRFRHCPGNWRQQKEPGFDGLFFEHATNNFLDECALQLFTKKIGHVTFSSNKPQARCFLNKSRNPNQIAQRIAI